MGRLADDGHLGEHWLIRSPERDTDLIGLVCDNNFVAHDHCEGRDSSPRRCRSRHREWHLDSMLAHTITVTIF